MLCDISVCFVTSVYMDCFVFFEGLHGSLWLVKLSLSAQRPRIPVGRICQRKDEAVGLHENLVPRMPVS
jgi:hypothetical protein